MRATMLPPRLSHAGRELVELISSMRFAISLLALICIASVIGTVVMQRQPANNYINQFGPFWAELFGRMDLFTVYSAPWFLLILAFLVISTSLCVIRNTPKILRDLRDAKLSLRPASLQAYRHKLQADWAQAPEAAQATLTARLQADGWRPKFDVRADGTLIAARKGAANKLGYIAAHSSIVLICLGGLLDGDLVVRTMAAMQGKTLYTGTGNTVKNIEEHRLDANNPSFRANLFVPEGDRAGVALIGVPGGTLLQQLPFELELKKFVVEYYDTGAPKLFASDVVLHDGEDTLSARIEVNKPLIHKGVAIYQSSFEDGGSKVAMRARPLHPGEPLDLQGQIGQPQPLPGSPFTLEPVELRLINVENFAGLQASAAASEPAKKFTDHLGAGAQLPGEKVLRNIGPSITYRLRDAAGQAIEYQNYMVPVEIDGTRVFLTGVRETAQDEFRYLRVPADENDAIDGWLRLRRALSDPELRARAAKDYAKLATPAGRTDLTQQLEDSATRLLGLFSGAEPQGEAKGGLPALVAHVEALAPAAEREALAGVLTRMLNGSLVELERLAREQERVAMPEVNPARERFMAQSVLALSDSAFYPAPLMVSLEGFEQRQASVFQVARAPGQKLVYLGSFLLTLGIFAMLYVRERRIWIWLAPSAAGGSSLTLALSSARQSSDLEADFQRLQQQLIETP